MQSITTHHQLEAIHAMMEQGQRSVRLEPHTLVLWGLAAAFLVLFINAVFTVTRFPVVWQRSLGANACIALVLVGVGVWDHRLTHAARRRRDETISFVQRQLMKVWWLLMGMIVLINLGMNFFGGGYLFYSVAFALMGLAFYIHGLFSEQILSWTGLALIALGLVSVALKLPYPAIEWLAVCVFGLGLPALGFVLDQKSVHATSGRRLATSATWLALMLLPATGIYALTQRGDIPSATPVTLADFQRRPAPAAKTEIVRIPAGSRVPMHIEIAADALTADNTVMLPLHLAQPLDIIVQDGQPDGRYRIGTGDWKQIRYNLRVTDVEKSATLTRDAGFAMNVRLVLDTDR